MGNKIKALWEQDILGCIIGILLIFGLAFGALCAEAGIAMFLWNECLVPAVGIEQQVGFWQTMGIMILIDSLFNTVSTINKIWK